MEEFDAPDRLILDVVKKDETVTEPKEEVVQEKEISVDPEIADALPDPSEKVILDVVNSEIGVVTLLNRLKQSVASAKEFALFLKKRSSLEEEHSNGLKKLCRVTSESIKKPDCRNGSFLSACEEITNIHEQMAENGAKFALSLHQMYDDLLELATNMERKRKYWKNIGLSAEQRVSDAEVAMRKSKQKYDTLAEDYDRAKIGDRQAGKLFGLKGPKSAAQHEEEVLRKLHAADAEYATRVQVAQNQRADLLSKFRPDTVNALQKLIKECDSALILQMQKFALFNEKLLLSNGLNVHPVKEFELANHNRSLRDAINSIDNDQDFNDYLMSFAKKAPLRTSVIEYQRHSVLNRTAQRYTENLANVPKQSHAQSFDSGSTKHHLSSNPQSYQESGVPASQKHDRNPNQNSELPQFNTEDALRVAGAGTNFNFNSNSKSFGYGKFSPQISPQPRISKQYHLPTNIENHPPIKPVFGISLEELFERDGSAVPMIVCQCIQAVDLFGLEVEGIYRLSGTASQISKIKSLFDNDASAVDFRDPANFFHDVNSVAGLLKQFFRDLPDPLLTSEYYPDFIEAAKNEDEILRRDSLHAIINGLPDPNYATLRAVTLHLNRVQENSSTNRMNVSNLSIVFGQTLMGASTGSRIQNAEWQVKVIDTILQNCYQIFDDD